MSIRNSQTLKFRFLLILALILGVSFGCSSSGNRQSGWDLLPAILREIVPPSFPAKDFNITEFGAVSDQVTDCSAAIQRAVVACYNAGGGRVIVPAGTFLTGAIHLKNNVNLHLMKDATLLFSRNPQNYLPVVLTRFEGTECMNYSPFIYACEQENIAITGEGILDGQADSTAWWPWAGKTEYGWRTGAPDSRLDRMRLFQMAKDGVPVRERIFGKDHYLRSNFIQFYRCRNILLEDITIRRSPMWEIHPVLCENVTVQRVKVMSNGPNNDGCDPESCRNVLIKDCLFDTGDDCIAIKSGRNEDGRRLRVSSENIVIQNCTMKDGHGGVVIGSEISGDCHNVFVENCTMDGTNLEKALRIKTNSLRGGIVENIYVRNLSIGEVKDAVIWIYFYYDEGDVGEYTPIVRNVTIKNITSKKSAFALLLEGYERSPISNILLEACEFNGVEKGNLLKHVEGLDLRNVYINGKLQ